VSEPPREDAADEELADQEPSVDAEAVEAEETAEADAAPSRGLLDTSVFIAREAGRELDESLLPGESAVSAVTVAELQAGVLAARDTDIRARGLATLGALSDVEVLVIDEAVAASWALLRVHLAESERRLNVNDLWIAATALTHRIPVVTQDDDFGPVEGVGGLRVVRV
jgi:predicted nucleic acid-binding protein